MNLSLCAEAERVLVNRRFLVTQGIVMLLNVPGIAICVYVTTLVAVSQILHRNLRILLVNLSMIICVRSILTLYRSTMYMVNAFTYTDSCMLVKETNKCKAFSAIAAAPFESLVFAFIGIAIERCVATVAYKRYENWHLPILAIAIAPVTWINMAFIIRSSFKQNGNEKTSYRAYCSTITTGYVNLPKLFNYSIPLICIGFCMFLVVYFICKRKLRLFLLSKVDDLSARYQLKENVKSTRVLAILASVYTVIVLTSLTAVAVISLYHIEDLLEFAILKEITSFAMPIYINVYSLVILTQCKHVRDRSVHLFTGRRRNRTAVEARVAPTMTAKEHMNILEKMWSAPANASIHNNAHRV